MFENPLKKFQQGGQVSQEQQEMLAAFVEWLPTAVEEFKNMQPEQIVEALNGMSKTPEGQKQVQSLMERFKQEISNPKMRFKEGGKIHQFICKHAKGGHVADCGCKQEGGSLEDQYGTISNDSRNGIRRAIDNVIGNSSTLSSIQRGFRNFKQSAPGKVISTLLPNPNSEGGMAASIGGLSTAEANLLKTIPTTNRFGRLLTDEERLHRMYQKAEASGMYSGITNYSTSRPKIMENVIGLNPLFEENGGTIEAQNGGFLQSDTPVHAAALAARKTTRVPWPGIGRRRMGAATDANGGKYFYESGDINGNSTETSVAIPAPGDTIVKQSIDAKNRSINRTYPMGSYEYESVMRRFRPFVVNGIPARQRGGIIDRSKFVVPSNQNEVLGTIPEYAGYTGVDDQGNKTITEGLAGRNLARRIVFRPERADTTIYNVATGQRFGSPYTPYANENPFETRIIPSKEAWKGANTAIDNARDAQLGTYQDGGEIVSMQRTPKNLVEFINRIPKKPVQPQGGLKEIKPVQRTPELVNPPIGGPAITKEQAEHLWKSRERKPKIANVGPFYRELAAVSTIK